MESVILIFLLDLRIFDGFDDSSPIFITSYQQLFLVCIQDVDILRSMVDILHMGLDGCKLCVYAVLLFL